MKIANNNGHETDSNDPEVLRLKYLSSWKTCH